MSSLFSPLQIKSITLHNRIAISPMCQYSSTDGFATDWHLVHLGSRATGGAGLVIQEATAVSPEGRITAHDMGLWKDEQIEKLKTITAFIRAQGSVPGIQLAHAGRKASTTRPWEGGKHLTPANNGWQTVSASAIPFREEEHHPEALSLEGIEKVKQDFKDATRRSREAGYQVVEIHAAHGYLLHQFLSPLSNYRTDHYGGSFENRVRLLLEVTAAVQSEWPAELPLFVRISATDWREGGWDAAQSVQLANLLKNQGVDLIDCSSGGLVPGVKIPVGPGYQVPFALQIKQHTGILTGAVGLITTAQQAEDILVREEADLILIARQSLRDPNFPLHAASELNVSVQWPPQYERAK